MMKLKSYRAGGLLRAKQSAHGRRSLLGVVLGISAALALTGCGQFFPSGNTLVAVSISPGNPTVEPNKTQQFTASGTFGDGSTRDVTSTVTWTSSSTNIATINSAGLATAGAGTGSTTITATSGSQSAATTLTVSNNTVSSISVSDTSGQTGTILLTAGTQDQLVATATLSDGSTQNVTNSVTWTSSNSNVATVSSTGLVTAKLASGTSTTITATSGSVTGTISVTVQ